MNDELECARLYAGGRAQAQRDLAELRQQRRRLCGDPSCVRSAVNWRRDAKGHWVGRCRIHGARNGLEKRRAMLDEIKKGMN